MVPTCPTMYDVHFHTHDFFHLLCCFVIFVVVFSSSTSTCFLLHSQASHVPQVNSISLTQIRLAIMNTVQLHVTTAQSENIRSRHGWMQKLHACSYRIKMIVTLIVNVNGTKRIQSAIERMVCLTEMVINAWHAQKDTRTINQAEAIAILALRENLPQPSAVELSVTNALWENIR